MDRGAPEALGERSVSVGGDIVGSLIVTGDNNNVRLVLGPEQGALLEKLARADRPSKRLRPAPVRATPPAFADSLDRDREARTILDALGSRAPINVVGERGIGKTYALLRAMNTEDPALAEGAVYLYAPGPLDDVLQLMFEAWYECEPPFRPSNPQLRRDLAEIRGLVGLDAVTLERQDAQQVLLAAAGSRVVVASRDRVLTDGTSIVLHGLEPEYAVVLVERELGRSLRDGEREDAARICGALDGHPLKIREAVASAREAGRSLADLASDLGQGEVDRVLSQEKRRTAGENDRRLLSALALFEDAPVGRDHLRAIGDGDDFEETLMAALRRRDAQAHSPRYDLGITASVAMEGADLAPMGDRALAHFTRWAEDNRTLPSVLMGEGAALIALLRWALRTRRLREVIRLGRAIDHAFALERSFGAWGQVLDLVHGAARDGGDRESEAWALHQLGTRALCLGDIARGAALLGQAIETRRELGDEAGAQLSADNLAVATRSGGLWRWITGHAMLLAVVAVLLVAGGVAAAALVHGGSSTPILGSTSNNGGQNGGGGGTTGGSSTVTTENSGGSVGTIATTGRQSTVTTPATMLLAQQVVGDGSITNDAGQPPCSNSCVLSLKPGTVVTLTATPTDGWLLQGWSGACASSDTTCTVTMTQDWDVTATFVAPPQ